MNDLQPEDKQETLYAILEECIARIESGCQVDPQAMAPHDAGLAAEIAEFLGDHQRVTNLLGEMQRLRREAPTLDTTTVSPVDSSFQLTASNSRFGKYELIDEIDRGGMGVVFRARHTELGRVVALKMIRAGELASADEVQRFRIEAQLAASLDHPGIVPVYEVGEVRGLHFYSMAYVDGVPLSRSVDPRTFSAEQAARLVQKLAASVTYAHDAGIIHRDLKPANVLIDANGEPRILDFGLAKQLHQNDGMTQTGQILGTPAYMAPEQARGDNSQCNEAVDIYALGAILYALCAGRAPHQAASPLETIVKVLENEPIPLRKIATDTPHALDQICMRCLQKNSDERYISAAALHADLERYLTGDPVDADTRSVAKRFISWTRRETALAAHLAGILPILLIIQLNHVWMNTDTNYWARHTTAFVCWAVACYGLQRATLRKGWADSVRLLWAMLDVLMITLVILLAYPPRGSLFVGYAVVIVASGMFLREQFVKMVTISTIAAFCFAVWAVQYWIEDESLYVQPHYLAIHIAALGVMGIFVANQVRRIHALSSYYGN